MTALLSVFFIYPSEWVAFICPPFFLKCVLCFIHWMAPTLHSMNKKKKLDLFAPKKEMDLFVVCWELFEWFRNWIIVINNKKFKPIWKTNRHFKAGRQNDKMCVIRSPTSNTNYPTIKPVIRNIWYRYYCVQYCTVRYEYANYPSQGEIIINAGMKWGRMEWMGNFHWIFIFTSVRYQGILQRY